MVRFVGYFLRHHLFLILAAVFVAIYYYSSSQISPEATIYPRIVMKAFIVVYILNIVDVVLDYRKYIKETPDLDVSVFSKIKPCVQSFLHDEDKKNSRTVLIIFGILVLYAILIPIIGFHVMSILFLVLVSLLLGAEKNYKLVIFILAMFACMYAIFDYWLVVPFPHGMLF